ncbi:MAG: histidine kinase [Lachnospiraceae bacterium]|nr:histidine kinase [Lachnospiraceae bacterium]
MKKKRKNRLIEIISKAKIRTQLYVIYTIAVFLPILVIGSFLMVNTGNLLTNYYRDLLESDNLRVKTILFEITNQIYNISEVISFEEALQDVLTVETPPEKSYTNPVLSYSTINNYLITHAEIEDITIYTDNPYAAEYMHFELADETVQQEEWYKKAVRQASIFWLPIERLDKYGNSYWNLCLVRKVTVIDSDYEAVLVIRISDNYLQTRIQSNEHRIEVASDDGKVFYSSERRGYGKAPTAYIDYTDRYYTYEGSVWEEEVKLFTNISALQIYQSESTLYIVTMNESAYGDIRGIVVTCLLIILVAMALPAILIHYFTGYFTGRINVLRLEMKKASKEDYDIIPAYGGEDELSEAFADLQVMVQRIKEKDAKMYAVKIKEQQLLNEQQVMEMKMLASQINPHFLYNTLESIRMQALTAGNKEVAGSVKLLGKSMRYVLENTGTSSITLQKELDYIETYLNIQKIRFRDRVNYSLVIEEGLVLEDYLVLPLLLQPVIENAILHGLEQTESGGRIEVKVSLQEDNFLQIVIVDNGCGMNEEELMALRQKIREQKIDTSSSIGLSNINRRIKLCYGELYGMSINSHPDEGTEVILLLPIKYA